MLLKHDERGIHTWPSVRAAALVFEGRIRRYREDNQFGKREGTKSRLCAPCSQQNITCASDARVLMDKANLETVFSPAMQGFQYTFWYPCTLVTPVGPNPKAHLNNASRPTVSRKQFLP